MSIYMEHGPHHHNHIHNDHLESSWGRRLFITMIMNLIIPAVQIMAGVMAGSMALISDALHNLSDFASILISYMALKIGKRGPTPSLTFALTSLGVAVLGMIWLFRPWYWLDPVVSWIIVALILYGGWGILKEALLILMNATPPGIDLNRVQEEVVALEGIEDLHHIHVWSPSSGTIAFAAHVIVPDQMLCRVDELAKKVRELLLHKFNIDHPTLQFETRSYQPRDLLCSLCKENKIL
jgi:Co/Zn/Cd efflux system component